MNRYQAANVASKITKVPAKDILSAWRKGAKPEGKTLYAVITASKLLHGTYHKAVAVETEPVVEG